MSELKYRFWVEGKILLPDDPANDFLVLPNGLIRRWNKSKGCLDPVAGAIALLYAGPTDQAGLEIGEADILNYGENKHGEVFYNKQTGSFLVRFAPPKNEFSLAFFLQLYGKPKIKIIGNSYQNPELKKLLGEKNEA